MLLSDASNTNVLLLPDSTGWTLPHFTPNLTDFRTVHHIQGYMRAQLGIESVVLRCIDQHHNATHGRWDRIYVLDNLNPATAQPNAALWVNGDELDNVQMANPEHSGIIRTGLRDIREAAPLDLPSPWVNKGWYNVAAEWIESQLNQLNLTRLGPVTPERTWALSCLMRVQTKTGTVYFKAVPPFMAQETTATLELSQRYPDLIRAPLAADRDHGWLLMSDFGGEALQTSPDTNHWEYVLRRWSHIQVEQVEHTQDWLQRGCPDRRLNRTVALIDPLIAVSTQLLSGRQHGLTDPELEGLASLSMKLKLLCANLAEYNIPPTLVHGDLPGNIHAHRDQYIIFDWTDVCIAHPFFDMAPIIDAIVEDTTIEPKQEVRNRLRDAYLEPWTAYETQDRLVHAFESSTSLGALHQAMSYMWILMNMAEDARWEVQGGLVMWLRRLLRLLPPNGA